MKLVVLDGYTLNPGDISWGGFDPLADITIYDQTPADEIVSRIGDAQAVLTNKTPLSKEVIDACPNLRYIGVLATGYNVIDIEAAKAKNIPVCNIPTYGTAAVAQFTIGLLLALCHHIETHSNSVYRGEWSECPNFCYWTHPLTELAGKTMGIIGFGRIGQNTAVIAKALGMNILAYDSYQSEEGKKIATYVTLDELFAKSDVISLHCPLFAETEGIICKENIAKMKDGVMILNSSRGPLVVEADLRDALNSGKVGGAGVDVVSCEPIKADNPLLDAKNCLITPHIAWAPKESRARLMDIAVANFASFQQGKIVNNVW